MEIKTDKRTNRKIHTDPKICVICGKIYERRTKSGERTASIKQFLKSSFCSKKCKGIHHSNLLKGKNNPNWKGGISTINNIIRGSYEYKLWREAVFKRDNWTCIWCGKKGGELNADHIKPFALYPELRFAIDNGRTLCIDCHKTTDTYGKKLLTNNIK